MNDKILWGQILAVFAIILFTIWSATQWTAAALGYQPELGQPWFWIGASPVYPPPAFFWWWFAFDAYAPSVFERGALIAVSGGFLSFMVAIAMSVWRARERRKAETYGSARWANEREIRKAGMLGDAGVVLGRFADTYTPISRKLLQMIGLAVSPSKPNSFSRLPRPMDGPQR